MKNIDFNFFFKPQKQLFPTCNKAINLKNIHIMLWDKLTKG